MGEQALDRQDDPEGARVRKRAVDEVVEHVEDDQRLHDDKA
jgi:hypothetical protein